MNATRMAQIKQQIADGEYGLLPGTCPPGCVEFVTERLATEIETMKMTKSQLVGRLEEIRERQTMTGGYLDAIHLRNDRIEAVGLLLRFIGDDKVTLTFGAIRKN